MEKYSKKFVALHWIHALILLFLLIGASLNLPDLPEVSGDLKPFKMHIIIGVVAIFLLISRLILVTKEPKFKLYDNSKEILVKWNHRLIYLVILITGASGIAMAKISNLGEVAVFGAEQKIYSGKSDTVELFANIHDISTKILIALITMHIIGVVLYTIQTKKKIIKRMWF